MYFLDRFFFFAAFQVENIKTYFLKQQMAKPKQFADLSPILVIFAYRKLRQLYLSRSAIQLCTSGLWGRW